MATILRRQFPRILVEGTLRIEFVPPSWPIVVLDVSTSGFLISSPFPIALGSKLLFRFGSSESDWSTTLMAVALHTRLRQESDRTPAMHITGFMFTDLDQTDVQASIDQILGLAIGPVLFI